MPRDTQANSVASFLAQRRAQQTEAVQQLEAALADGTDEEVVTAAVRVRKLGAVSTNIAWEAVYFVEERHVEVGALRKALADHDDQATAEAWTRVRARFSDYLTEAERKEAVAAFQRWGRRLRMVELENSNMATS